jgi:hypothetical protein
MKKLMPYLIDVLMGIMLAAIFIYIIEGVREYMQEQKILNHSQIPADTTNIK